MCRKPLNKGSRVLVKKYCGYNSYLFCFEGICPESRFCPVQSDLDVSRLVQSRLDAGVRE